MLRNARILAAITLVAATPAMAAATEYLPVTTGAWQPSRASDRAAAQGTGQRGILSTGAWAPSKPGARWSGATTPPVVVRAGPWTPSRGPARIAPRGE